MHQITPGKTRRVIPQRAIQTNIRFSNGVSIVLALFLWGKGVGALRSLFEHELGMNARLSIGSGGSR